MHIIKLYSTLTGFYNDQSAIHMFTYMETYKIRNFWSFIN